MDDNEWRDLFERFLKWINPNRRWTRAEREFYVGFGTLVMKRVLGE